VPCSDFLLLLPTVFSQHEGHLHVRDGRAPDALRVSILMDFQGCLPPPSGLVFNECKYKLHLFNRNQRHLDTSGLLWHLRLLTKAPGGQKAHEFAGLAPAPLSAPECPTAWPQSLGQLPGSAFPNIPPSPGGEWQWGDLCSLRSCHQDCASVSTVKSPDSHSVPHDSGRGWLAVHLGRWCPW
jgi:hypothetical protein